MRCVESAVIREFENGISGMCPLFRMDGQCRLHHFKIKHLGKYVPGSPLNIAFIKTIAHA